MIKFPLIRYKVRIDAFVTNMPMKLVRECVLMKMLDVRYLWLDESMNQKERKFKLKI